MPPVVAVPVPTGRAASPATPLNERMPRIFGRGGTGSGLPRATRAKQRHRGTLPSPARPCRLVGGGCWLPSRCRVPNSLRSNSATRPRASIHTPARIRRFPGEYLHTNAPQSTPEASGECTYTPGVDSGAFPVCVGLKTDSLPLLRFNGCNPALLQGTASLQLVSADRPPHVLVRRTKRLFGVGSPLGPLCPAGGFHKQFQAVHPKPQAPEAGRFRNSCRMDRMYSGCAVVRAIRCVLMGMFVGIWHQKTEYVGDTKCCRVFMTHIRPRAKRRTRSIQTAVRVLHPAVKAFSNACLPLTDAILT